MRPCVVIPRAMSVRARAQRLMHTSDARRLIKIIELQLYPLMRVNTDDLSSKSIHSATARECLFVLEECLFILTLMIYQANPSIQRPCESVCLFSKNVCLFRVAHLRAKRRRCRNVYFLPLNADSYIDRPAVRAAAVDKAQTQVNGERGCIPNTHTRC